MKVHLEWRVPVKQDGPRADNFSKPVKWVNRD